MPDCQWRDKPGLPPTCNVVVAAGEEYCPRHQFLSKVNEDKQQKKELKLALDGKLVKKLPANRRELLEQGYQAIGNGNCSGCKALIQWFRTPNGRNAPYDPMEAETSPAVSHFATCPARAEFRRSA